MSYSHVSSFSMHSLFTLRSYIHLPARQCMQSFTFCDRCVAAQVILVQILLPVSMKWALQLPLRHEGLLCYF